MLKNDPWLAPNPTMLPDFIIGGAMKCATTTLHNILNTHPKISIPKAELHFFDRDDYLQHSNFNYFKNNTWETPLSITEHPAEVWAWYENFFKTNNKSLKGEDSTCYLPSYHAAKRIAMQEKPIKLIFILRQPSDRAFSNYTHLLKSGRAIYSFEDTIRNAPFDVLHRSLYLEQLQRFYNVIPKERIKVVLFEDLLENVERVIASISEFLEIDFNQFPKEAFTIYENKGVTHRYLKLNQIKNYFLQEMSGSYIVNLLTYKNRFTPISLKSKYLSKIHTVLNPKKSIAFKINPETKLFLDAYFQSQLKGIDELTGQDILAKWFPK